MRPRLGHIQFLNCLPLYYGLVKQDVLLDVDLVKADPDGPARLIRRRASSTSRRSPRSSTRATPTTSCCCPTSRSRRDGEVQSILLLSKRAGRGARRRDRRAHEHARARRRCSRASCSRSAGASTPTTSRCRPTWPRCCARPTRRCSSATTRCARTGTRPTGLHAYDLGTEWKAWTGLPMVYAVWAVRREFAEAQPGRGARGRRRARTRSLDVLPRASRRHLRVRRALGAVPGGALPQLLRRAAVPLRAALPRGPAGATSPRPPRSASSSACPRSASSERS